jgi:hypothetical protein
VLTNINPNDRGFEMPADDANTSASIVSQPFSSRWYVDAQQPGQASARPSS